MDINLIDINLLFRLCIFIVIFGIAFKVIKLISGVIFKVASVILILLLIYKLFI